MIPTYNPDPDQLAQVLLSVLSQDPGRETMQIEVLDDCSSQVDVEQMVRAVAGDRVQFSKNSENKGLAGSWNACIERARGVWVHILHQDDYVLPGFYEEGRKIGRSHPDVGLIALRSFFVDENGVIGGVTPRIRSLEHGGHDVRELLYDNQLQCPGIVVSKEAYDKYGNFRLDLTYTLDWEMWTRIVSEAGGVVSEKVLSCYRTTTHNMTNRLAKSAETLTDRARINRIFAERYKEFDTETANERVCEVALQNAQTFKMSHDHQAADAYMKYWRQNAPLTAKVKYYGRAMYHKLARSLSAS